MKTTLGSRSLILILCLALAGLTGILALLLRDAWLAKEQALVRNVNTALAAAAQQLEADEIVGQATMFFSGNGSLDTVVRDSLSHTWPRTRDAELFMIDADSVRVMHFLKASNDGGIFVFPEQDSTHARVRLETDRLTYHVTGERTALVQRLVGDLVHQQPRSITDRLSVSMIDSVLNQQLENVEIEVTPHFAVVSSGTTTASLSNLADPTPLLNQPVFRTRLFPLDLAPPHYELLVHLPASRNLVLAQIWPLAAASLVFLLVVAAAFAQAVRTIERQQRFTGQVVDFINNLTHEFKTPLATVSLACQALGKNDPDEKTTRYLGMINEENEKLGRQVDKILQMAQLERSGVRRGNEKVDLAAVVANSAAHFVLQAEGLGGQINTHLPPEPLQVTGDPMHLAAIVDNLVDNAVKYAQGKPQVDVHLTKNADHAVIEVQDQGPGIAPRDQERLFEPYYRCPTGNRHDVKGFGLGLGFVKLLTELHEGRVQLQSRPGHGTRITVHLPLAKMEERAS